VSRFVSALREALLALAVVWIVPLLLLALLLPLAGLAWVVLRAMEAFS
jgi:hypothetical protein